MHAIADGIAVRMSRCAHSSREMVDAFHAAALAHGGASDGAPGLRPQHGEGYYAAFIRDPDGNRIEAVTFPEVDGYSRSAAPDFHQLLGFRQRARSFEQLRQDVLDPVRDEQA